jgi:hypothetical protein
MLEIDAGKAMNANGQRQCHAAFEGFNDGD